MMVRVTTHLAFGVFFLQRYVALRADPTQMVPHGWFFAVPLEIQQKIWPTEEFELAKTRVSTSIPETDLFAGLEEDV
jgi:mycothiol S-conjugate amidase